MLQLHMPYQLTSNKLATTCNLFAVAAVHFNISPSSKTSGADKNSTVVFAATALTLNNENTLLPLVTVTVSVSAFPLSSEAKKDFTIVVVALGTVYKTVAPVLVSVTDNVSAFPESSETNNDLKTAVVAVGQVYSTVAFVVVKSSFALRKLLANKPTHCLGSIFRCFCCRRRSEICRLLLQFQSVV